MKLSLTSRLIAFALTVMAVACTAQATPYNFQSASGRNVWIEVDAWTGSGPNETILVVDWNFMGGPYQTESHAFGFRWDSIAYESDMLDAFHNAGIFSLTSGYGGAFIYNIAYNDGTESHLHTELGSWKLASTDNPYAQWGAMGPDWKKLGEWDANRAGYNEELLHHGHLEGINAIFWFGDYPDGKWIDDYPLNVPFASVPEPATLGLLAIGMLGFIGKRRMN